MNPHFTILGLTFYWYGLIVGLAIALVLVLVDRRASIFDQQAFADKKAIIKSRKALVQPFFQQWSMAILAGGFIGARLWHVATDWQLYRFHWQSMFALSQGGLSILGGILGGILSILLLKRLVPTVRQLPVLLITDLLVFGLPFGQALGRLGNWINQELYGLPSNLPWALTISPELRFAGFETVERYHPLFLYEAVLMVTLGVALWILVKKYPQRLGSGLFTLVYLSIYSILRFGLDFLRIDRPVWQGGLSVNQLVLLGVWLLMLGIWGILLQKRYFSPPAPAAKVIKK